VKSNFYAWITFTTPTWNLKPIEGFRFPRKGDPFSTYPEHGGGAGFLALPSPTAHLVGIFRATKSSHLLLDLIHASLACLGEHRYRLPASTKKSKDRVPDLQQALKMIDVFASVGATHFDLTQINIEGEKRGFRPRQTIAQLKTSLPKLFPGAAERQNNIIVRPYADQTSFIQLDDLNEAGLAG
jgi:hypothetical protein